MSVQLIDQYVEGGSRLRSGVRGLSAQDLQWRPGPELAIGLWSIQEIVVHLQDSDAVLIHRMKQIIAEECPLLMAWDEGLFVKSLFYHEQSVEDAVTLFEVGRRNFGLVLRRLGEPAFARRGIHSQRGEVRLGQLIQDSINHLENHLKYVHLKRQHLVGSAPRTTT